MRGRLKGLGMTTLILEEQPAAVNVTFSDEKLIVDLADGRTLAVPLEWYPRLVHGSQQERENWNLLGRRSGESQKSFERWLSTRRRRG